MTRKMKGLFRGLRYISHIFDEKEHEMQIGQPTDVKHVAHIGWDGPYATKPSWMNAFKYPTEVSSEQLKSNQEAKTQDQMQTERLTTQRSKSQRPCKGDGGSPTSMPTRKSKDAARHSKNQSSSNNVSLQGNNNKAPKNFRRNCSSVDTKNGESLEIAKQYQNSSNSPGHNNNQASILIQSQGRKSKGSSGGRSSRSSSKLKEQNPSSVGGLSFTTRGLEDSEFAQGMKNIASHLTAVLEVYEEDR